MIKPKCDKCGEELKAYGALAFSPPETKPDESCGRDVQKYHICAECWPDFLAWLGISTCDECGGPMPQAYEDPAGNHYCAKCA